MNHRISTSICAFAALALHLFAPGNLGAQQPGDVLHFDTSLESLNLTGGPFPIPLASDPANQLGDSIDGYGFVLCDVSISLASQRAANPGPPSTGQAVASRGLAKGGAMPGMDELIDPELLDGELFFVDSFFDVFFDITVTDVDSRPGRDFAGVPDGASITLQDNGPANMRSNHTAVFDAVVPNFGLLPPPAANPFVGNFLIEIPLGADINGNGEDDKIKFTLATNSVGDENRISTTLPDGTVMDQFESAAFLDGAVVDESSDPPFRIGAALPGGLPDPSALGGPTMATSNLLNPVIVGPNHIDPGFDLFSTPAGSTELTLVGPSGAVLVALEGMPLNLPEFGGVLSDTDTIIQRLGGGDPLPGGSATVPIELVALSLRSVNPVDVGGTLFDVTVIGGSLNGQPAPPGQMEIARVDQNGGTYNSTFPVRAMITLTEVGNPANEIRNPSLDFFFIEQAPWLHIPSPVYPHAEEFPSGGFFPGVILDPKTHGAVRALTIARGEFGQQGLLPAMKVPKWIQEAQNMAGENIPSDIDWRTISEKPPAIPPNWVVADDFRSDGRPIAGVHWWGSYFQPEDEPIRTTEGYIPVVEDAFVVSFFSDQPATPNGGSRPDVLLGSYIVPKEKVSIQPTDKIGWDGHRLWQYQINLEDAHLEHASALATSRTFNEVEGEIYWISIVASNGHELIADASGEGSFVDNNDPFRTEHFWGWHTSPDAFNGTAVMGELFMPGVDWLYANWTEIEPEHNDLFDMTFTLLVGAAEEGGSIHGTKWEDQNGNGQRDAGEHGLAGWTIDLLDPAGNVILSTVTMADDPLTALDEAGMYWFQNLSAGDFLVAERQQVGWTQTFPAPPGLHSVSLSAGQMIEGLDFGNRREDNGSVHGTKWEDLNGNGERDAGEPGLAGVTIYTDLNNNGQLDVGEPRTVTMVDDSSTQVDESGQYWLQNLEPGTYVVREVVPDGFVQTFPSNGAHTVVLAGGDAVQDLDFGNRPDLPGSIHGIKWNDLNGNGQRDAGEPGLADWTINLRDPAGTVILSTTTMADDPRTTVDETGMYWFQNLSAGEFLVAERQQAGWVQTFPAPPGFHSVTLSAGQTIESLDFGNVVTGFVEVDVFENTLAELVVELPPQPGVMTPLPNLPPRGAVYLSARGADARFAGGGPEVILRNIRHRPFADPSPVVTVQGEDELARFNSSLCATAVIAGGVALEINLTGPVEVISRGKAGQTTGSWDTEILSMDLTGSIPGGPTIVIRESNAMASPGQTTVTDLGGGQFHIDSFFDVFTELSIDGGGFVPATEPVRVVAFESGVESPNANLPPDNGVFCAPELTSFESVDIEGARLRAGRVVDRRNENGNEITTLEVTLTGLADDGDARTPIGLPGTMEVIVFERGQGSNTGTFDTEIVSMSLFGNLGGVPINLQESPTQPSRGQAEITDLGDGTFQIDSFFDVFTEISVDSGPFVPATSAPRFKLCPKPEEATVVLSGPSTVNVFFEGPNEGDASDDPNPATDPDSLDEVQTEIVSLSLTGTTPLGPVVVRLRTDEPSIGEIEEQVNNIPGRLDLNPFHDGNADSFFDVFFEIDIAGQTLRPATGSTRLSAVITEKPPAPGEEYRVDPPAPVELVDAATGLGSGIYIVRQTNTPRPVLPRKIDVFDYTLGKFDLQLPDGSSEQVTVAGPASVQTNIDSTTGGASDTDGDGLDQVQTEMLSMNLRGNSSQGAVTVTLDPGRRTLGELEEKVNNTPGILDIPPFTAEGQANAFFDVWMELEINGVRFLGDLPVRLGSMISNCPPGEGEVFMSPGSQPIELIHALTGERSGILLTSAMHTPRPSKEINFFENAVAKIQLRRSDESLECVVVTGPTVVQACIDQNGTAADTDANGRDQVPTEIVSMNLTGTSSFGPVIVTLDPIRRSVGQMEERVNSTPGLFDLPPFTIGGQADSSFDVFFRLNVAGNVLTGVNPIRIESVITSDPPGQGETFMNPVPESIDLIDQNGNSTGLQLASVMHTPYPTAYELWAAFHGLDCNNSDPDDDSNEDGQINAKHFAYNTDPLAGDGNPGDDRFRLAIVDEVPRSYATFTFPARDEVVFEPGAKPVDRVVFRGPQIVYLLRMNTDLGERGTLDVREMVPALDAGLPELDPGWSYRTVQLLDSVEDVRRAFIIPEGQLLTP